MISFQCPGCQTTINVKEDKIGRKARCPDCKSVFKVPKPGHEPRLIEQGAGQEIDEPATFDGGGGIPDAGSSTASPHAHDPRSSIDYSLRRVLGKGTFVVYRCPSCGQELEALLEDAGGREPCPFCGEQMTVPGERELAAQRAEQQARQAEVEARRAEAERQRIEREQKEEAERVQRIQQEAQRKLQRNQHRLKADKESFESLRESTSSDRVLWFAFKFAKLISVVVIVICLVSAAGAAAGLLIVQPDLQSPRSASQIQAEASQFSTLQAELDAAQRRRQGAAPAERSPEPSYRSDTLEELSPRQLLERQFGVRIRRIISTYKIDSSGYQVLIGWLAALPTEHREPFMAGLTALLEEAQKHFVNRQNDPNWSYTDTIHWYRDRYVTALAENEHIEDQNREARLEAAEKRRLMMMVIASAVAALLAFLVLPLLIQIEHNTRVLLEG